MSEADLELIRRVTQGDSKAFEGILQKYERPIFNLVYRMVKNHDDAMEISQTVFTKVYERLDTYDPSHKLFSWICKIAVNQSLNHINRKKREMELDGDFAVSHRTPEDQAEDSERGRHLDSALMELRFDNRIAIVLKYFMDLSYKEMADILEIPEKTVKSRLFTGRQILKDLLIKRGYGE